MNKKTVKKRILFFFSSMVIVVCFLLGYVHSSLMPLIYEYGRYQCVNISTRLVNHVVSSQLSEQLKSKIIDYNKEDTFSISFNTSILNSIASNTTKKLQYYFYKLEKGELEEEILNIIDIDNILKNEKGIIFKVPFSKIFDNLLISNLGVEIPIRYKLIGSIKTQMISSVKEFGINNALIEINFEINLNSSITVPMLSKNENVIIVVPIVIQLIEGEVPNYLFGTNVVGGGIQ